MQISFRLAATSAAVLMALGLSACGGSDGSGFNGVGNPTSVVDAMAGLGGSSSSSASSSSSSTGSSSSSASSSSSSSGSSSSSSSGSSSLSGTEDEEDPVIHTNDSTTYTSTKDTDNVNGVFFLGTQDGSVAKTESINIERARLSEELETAYSKKLINDTPFIYRANLSGTAQKTYASADEIHFNELGDGYQKYDLNEYIETTLDDSEQYKGSRSSVLKFYQGANSIVLGRQVVEGELSKKDGSDPKQIESTAFAVDTLKGSVFNPPSAEELSALQEQKNAAAEELASAQETLNTAQSELTTADQALQNALSSGVVDDITKAQEDYEKAYETFQTAESDVQAAASALASATAVLQAGADAFNVWARYPENTALSSVNTSVESSLIDESKNHRIFSYKGQAFDGQTANNPGALSYEINFSTRTGEGTIADLGSVSKIVLATGHIGKVTQANLDGKSLEALGIQGSAKFTDAANADRADGTYTLGIFGNEATEIAGFVSESGVNTIGFGGTKQSERSGK